jgi:hypothetical protein
MSVLVARSCVRVGVRWSCVKRRRGGRCRPQNIGALDCPTVHSVAPQFTALLLAPCGREKQRRIGRPPPASRNAWRNIGSPVPIRFQIAASSHSCGCCSEFAPASGVRFPERIGKLWEATANPGACHVNMAQSYPQDNDTEPERFSGTNSAARRSRDIQIQLRHQGRSIATLKRWVIHGSGADPFTRGA